MEGGIWGDGVYAFSSSEKPFIYVLLPGGVLNSSWLFLNW
jgi:hypothetical protein